MASENLTGGCFDLIIAADALHRVAPDAALLARVVETMCHLMPCWSRLSRYLHYSAILFLVSSGTGCLARRPSRSLSALSDWAARLRPHPARPRGRTIGTAG